MTQNTNAYEIPGFQITLPTQATDAAPIPQYRFMSIDANGCAVLATASTVILGASRNVSNDTIQTVDIASGIMMVECAAAITVGSIVASDAEGKAVSGTDTSMVAMSTTANAGELVAVYI